MQNKHDVDFIGRTADLDRYWELLDSQSIVLSGARRVGKSELLKQMVKNPAPGWKAVRVDVEGLRDVAGAALRFERDLEDAGLLTDLADTLEAEVRLPGVKVRQAPRPGDPWDRVEDLVRRATPSEPRLALLIDELPWWLDALRRTSDEVARAALARLRYIRDRDPRVRMVLTGSVGLAGLARALGASAELNDLYPMVLPPLPLEDAGTLFEIELARRGIDTDEGARELAWRETGGSPHWLKNIAQRVQGAHAGRTEIESAIEALLSRRLRDLFDDEGRAHLLRRHGAERADRMRAVLSAAATQPEGLGEGALVAVALSADETSRAGAKELVYLLIDEFYLEPKDELLRFANPLLRRWWQKYGDLR